MGVRYTLETKKRVTKIEMPVCILICDTDKKDREKVISVMFNHYFLLQFIITRMFYGGW